MSLSKKVKAPSDGDRIDLGGKLPQFDEFAWLAYKELNYGNLDWIRVADPLALKLDDIQFSTRTEIHAYQVKWSNQENPPPFRFKEFSALLPEILSGWNSIKKHHSNEGKKVFAHLLTNRPLSTNDTINSGSESIGSFDDFVREVWNRIRIGKSYDQKWTDIVDIICEQLSISQISFFDFCRHVEVQHTYIPKVFKSTDQEAIKQSRDLLQFSRFLLESIVDKKKPIQFDRKTLINALGWSQRFQTKFQHELIIDKTKYQPIQTSIDELNEKILQINNGYFFLIGGPGTGKSTLLTQWSRGRKGKVIKYFAFDFSNPAQNYHQRGESLSLFFDLVVQLKNEGVGKGETIPHDDLGFLRKYFFEQLEELNKSFKEKGENTTIIIDGLDHIPREYLSVKQSFLRDLPTPSSVPVGVQIILGSQSFELADLSPDITREWKNPNRTVSIAPLERKAVSKYLVDTGIEIQLSEEQKANVFEKSQGHPLYLSYLVEKLRSSSDYDSVLDGFDQLDGQIDEYYRKLWIQIGRDAELINFLALLARVKGNINPNFVQEWNFGDQTILNFKERARHLLDRSVDRWAFFHNSFRQFLIHETALSRLTELFDKERDIDFHKQLIDFYNTSRIEPKWNSHYHLFLVGQFEEEQGVESVNSLDLFLEQATPENFIDQLKSYRPLYRIREEINLGIQVALVRKDVYLLSRYIFSAAELERRSSEFDPAGLTKEFLNLKMPQIAKDFLRRDSELLCKKDYALEACRMFYEYGDKVEAKILFSLAEPDEITESSILVKHDHHYQETRELLEEWIYTSVLFYPSERVVSLINNLELIKETPSNFDESITQLKQRLFYSLCQSFINNHQWDLLLNYLSLFNNSKHGKHYWFSLLREAVNECISSGEMGRAQNLLSLILQKVNPKKSQPKGKVIVANLIYKVTGDLSLVKEWINDLDQPATPAFSDFYRNDSSLDQFEYRIVYNKLLKLLGKAPNILTAVAPPKDPKDHLIVEFEQKLCLISELLAEDPTYQVNTINRVRPILEFYYRAAPRRDSYWYHLLGRKGAYHDLLIFAISRLGLDHLILLADHVFSEFERVPEYWNYDHRRKVIMSFFENGLDKERALKQLISLEESMTDGADLSGRIESCIQQAKAYVQMNISDYAKYWIQQTISESLGVGYSKDYQFDTWIDWLKIINKKDPRNGAERIKWFLSQLKYIQESTEAAGLSASENLLRATFELNFSFGIEQLQWQLNKGLIHFEDAIKILLKQSLIANIDYQIVFKVYCNLFLLMAEQVWEDLLSLFLEKGFSHSKISFVGEFLPTLINAVEIKVLEEKRAIYFEIIHGFIKGNSITLPSNISEILVPKLEKKRERSSVNELVILPDHHHIPEWTVLSEVNSCQDLISLLSNEDVTNSYFRWDKVLDKISKDLTISDVQELSKLISTTRRSTFLYAKLSELAFNLGDSELALELGNAALEHSSSSGWIQFHDGGTRIKAFGALQRVNKQTQTDRAFEVFSKDLIVSNYPSSYVEHLDEILPLISQDFDPAKAWPEVNGYIRRLMINSKAISDLPEFKTNKSPDEALILLLFNLADHPVFLIGERIRICLVELLTQNELLITQLKILSNGNPTQQELFFDLVAMMHFHCPNLIERFKDELKNHQTSQNYFIRKTAINLLSLIDSKHIPIFPSKRKLAPIYGLHFPEIRDAFGDELDSQDHVKDTSNLRTVFGPYLIWIRYLSKHSKVEESNLLFRLEEIISEFGESHKLTSKYEKNIRFNLQQVNFNTTFPRPRFLIARKALLYLLTELIDSGKIKAGCHFNGLDYYDFEVSFIPEAKKPNFVHRISNEEYSSVSDSWVNEIDASPRLLEGLVKYGNNWHVIGEYSFIRSLYWGLPTEIYMSQLIVSDPKNSPSKEDYWLFAGLHQVQINDYHNIQDTLSFPYLIAVNQHRYVRSDPRSNWIAMNPDFADYLGWLPGKAPLSWIDKEGDMIAQSVFWTSGNIEMRPPRLHSESGQGWLVLVSNKGLKQIESLGESLVIQKKINRENYEDGEIIKNLEAREIPYVKKKT
mgnify:CR=1 FL=1